MALTNFASLTDEQKTIWARDTWKNARNAMFLNRFLGDGSNSMIQRISELRKTEKGARAVITLVKDLEGDGVAGDRTLEGNEEAILSFDQVIQVDQLRHANRHEGRIADQRSVVEFRENSRDVLAYWLADRLDQMSFLTLTGVSFAFKTDGAARVGSDLPFLEFAADVTAPTTLRHRNWDDSADALVAGDTATIAADDLPSWRMLVKMKAFAKINFIRPIRGEGPFSGAVMYNVFMHPDAIAHLKLDPDFLAAWRNAMPRSGANVLFRDADVYFVDNLAIREFFHVFNTLGAAGGSKFGAGGNVDGSSTLLCGSQAMAFADIGDPYWVEDGFDYENQQGISLGKMCGTLKPVFRSHASGTDEDFAVLRVNHAI
jgi:N4-gp56 family major capsid protein